MISLSALLISIGSVAGIAGFLAFLMVIADATIANYGEVNISINDDKKLKVKGGASLLSTLASEGIFIPSACGGRGSCGLCKVKVLSGAGQYLPTELPWISAEEQEQNIRLSCQLKCKEDLRIEIPEELFNVKEYRTKVSEIRDLTHDIKEITLEIISPPEINLVAGQFIQFQVPEYDLTDEPVYRAYSIASVPSQMKQIELEIRYVPDGVCTTYVHKYLKEGQEVIINGPYGEFYLRDSEREIVCIAGGSGMAPIKSILLDMAEKGSQRKTRYFFGARSRKDLFLVEELHRLSEKMPNFTFIPALSEPQPEDNWEGETGLITDVLDRHLKQPAVIDAYLCGSPGMIDACVQVLNKHDVTEDHIFYDKFG